jgi:acyl carrier protein
MRSNAGYPCPAKGCAGKNAKGSSAMSSTAPWLGQLLGVPLSERAHLLEEVIEGEFRDWLQLDSSEALPRDESFFTLGVTSLGVVEMRERLEAALGRRIDTTVFYNKPTIRHLASHLRESLLGDIFAERSLTQVNQAKSSTTAAGGAARSDDTAAARQVVEDLFASFYRD